MTQSLEGAGPSAAADVVDLPAAARPETEPDKAPSAAADVVGLPAAARPETEPDKAAETASLAGVTGGNQKEKDGSFARQATELTGGDQKNGLHQAAENTGGSLVHQAAEVTGRPLVHQAAEVTGGHQEGKPAQEIAEPLRFAPIKDVKTMLQTGLFEGKRIVYKNRKDKIDLLQGVIRGTSYFCLCGADCDKTGKELSARSFEQHAKGDSHNPNDHIFLHLLNVSLFDLSKTLKECKDVSVLQERLNKIMQPNETDHCSKKVAATNGTSKDCLLILERIEILEKRMEQLEKKVDRLEQMQSQINTLEQNIDFLVNRTVRSQKVFEEVATAFGKLSDI